MVPRGTSPFPLHLAVLLAAILWPVTSTAEVYRLTPEDDWFRILSHNRLEPGDEVILAEGIPGTWPRSPCQTVLPPLDPLRTEAIATRLIASTCRNRSQRC